MNSPDDDDDFPDVVILEDDDLIPVHYPEEPTAEAHDFPDALDAILRGMAESRIMEKLSLTEEIVEATGLDVDDAFAKASAIVNDDKVAKDQ